MFDYFALFKKEKLIGFMLLKKKKIIQLNNNLLILINFINVKL